MSEEILRIEAARDIERPIRLWGIEPPDLTSDQLFDILSDRYEPTTVPSCRICGAALSIGAVGGGEPTRWYCSAMAAAKGGEMDWKHFSESLWVDRRRGGDPHVMELVRRFQQSNP